VTQLHYPTLSSLIALLWLLGSPPQHGDIPVYDPNSERIAWERTVGPILTDEKCDVLVDKIIGRPDPDKSLPWADIWDAPGHKVCMEVRRIDCHPGDLFFGSSTGGNCGRPEKVISRHCWCAEEEK